MRAAFLLVLALSAVQAPVQGPLGLAVRVAPEPTYIERTPAGQLLTCDFEIVNGTDQALELVGIWARSFAANGRLLLRNKVDSNGTRPSVEVLGRRRLEPRSTLTVFNPFTELRTAVPIARIEYEFSLQDSSKERQRVKAEVRQGDVLGQMGRSGMGSQLNHVHYELRTSPDLFKAEGLPAQFQGFRRVGARAKESGRIDAGWIVITEPRPGSRSPE